MWENYNNEGGLSEGLCTIPVLRLLAKVAMSRGHLIIFRDFT
jgi:hypothetical protein